MPTEIRYEPIVLESLEDSLQKAIQAEIRNSIEYVEACEQARDDVLLYHHYSPSQKLVELNALMRILMNYQQLREATRLRVVK